MRKLIAIFVAASFAAVSATSFAAEAKKEEKAAAKVDCSKKENAKAKECEKKEAAPAKK